MGNDCIGRKEKHLNQNAYLTPRILRETSAGLFAHDIQDEMLADREVELVGEIDADVVNSLIRQLRHLQKEDPDGLITLFINSPGGEVSSGLALYDVMQAVSCPIRTVCLGTAASMGAVLFMAGDERDMLAHSQVMIHDPLIGGVGGSALSVKARADSLMRVREVMAQVIAKHTGKTLEEVYELTATDTYFEAEAAVQAGIADRIVSSL